MTGLNQLQDSSRLEVPARAEFVSVLRLVVGAASGSHPWVKSERLEDLKLAVSEACISLMSAEAATIEMTTRIDDSQLSVELRAGGASAAQSLPKTAIVAPNSTGRAFEFGTPLVSMLVDKVETSRESDSVVLVVLRDPEIIH